MNENNSFIRCDNEEISFLLDGDKYTIPRKEIEEKLNLYWFMGTLYYTIIDQVKNKPEWILEYKHKES